MANEQLDCVHIDDDIIVINKTAGMLTIPDRFFKKAVSLKELLQNEYGEVFVVHRLDRETSGAIVFARNADSHRILNEQFSNHSVNKLYHAIVSGIINEDSFEIDIPIMPNPAKPGTMIPSARGKSASTLVRVKERYKFASWVECKLQTGRQHQLRVHFAAIGHPLLVDSIYGNNEKFYLSTLKRRFNLKKNTQELPIISRLTLHSYLLEFLHPKTQELISFQIDYPKDFKATLQVMRKYSSFKEYSIVR